MTNGLFLSENQRKKMGAAVPLCPEMVEIFQSSGCRPQLSLLGLPGWSIFFFSDNFRDFFYSFPPVAVDGIKVETAGEVAGQEENDAGRCAKSW